MNLSDVIRCTFVPKLEEYGAEVLNEKKNVSFKAFVTAGDLSAFFTVGDQELSESVQLTTLAENTPQTGDVLLVDNRRYTVQGIQRRPDGPIVRIYCELK